MASGLSGRANSSSKGFDFGTDDILCSYNDYGNQDSSNGGLVDATVGSNSSKDFNKSRVTRSAVFPAAVYNQPEETLNQDLLSSVDRGMKKHSDNIMRILEGISSRLSQLELYCYNLDKSIGEMRSDLVRDHGEAESKLKSLDKHVQEVHRSVQILRDKQELAENQKELAKLQLVQKESTSSSHSQSTDERASEPKKPNISSEATNLALSLPQQVNPPQQSLPSIPAPAQNATQQQSYYVPSNQLSNPPAPAPVPAPVPAMVPAPAQLPQSYLPSNPQYQAPQLQEPAPVALQPTYSQPQVSQTSQFQQPFTQYQQQWPQQLPPQVQPPQPTQIRPQAPQPVYSSYPQSQPSNPTPENQPNSMTMQVPFSSIPQPGSSSVDAMPYGYAGSSRPVLQQPQQQPPPPQMKGTYGAQVGNAYGPHPGLPAGHTYVVYDNNGVRTHNPPQQLQYNPGGYPPTSVPLQNAPPATYTPSNVPLQNAQPAPGPHLMARNPSHSPFVHNHPHSDLIEKLGNMGFRSDHVAGVIQRLEESGQPVDFNNVLDRLSGNPSAVPQRGWGR